MSSSSARKCRLNQDADDSPYPLMVEISVSPEEFVGNKNAGVIADRKTVDLIAGEKNSNAITENEGCITKIRAKAGTVVNNKYFQHVIIVLILVNSAMMGIGTFSAIKDTEDIFWAFEWTDQAFLIVFTLELLLQFTYHGHRLFFDGWLVFDFVIVVLSWALQSLQIIRAFRTFRALRLVSQVQSLRALISAIFSVIPRMLAIVFVLVLIFYIFAVMFVQLFRDLPLDKNYFGGLDFTALTLFQLMTLEEWSVITRDVMDQEPLFWIPILSFIMVSSLIVYNLVVAVVCDSINVLSRYSEEKDENSFIARKELARITTQVANLQKAQMGVQEKLDELTLALLDAGVVNIHQRVSVRKPNKAQ